MKTLSLSSFNSSMSMPSFSGVLSRNPDLARRLNKMTGNRIPILKTASRRSRMNYSLPWLAGAGAVALLGAGLGLVAKKFGGQNMISSLTGDQASDTANSYSISEKYPAGFASAGSIPTPSKTGM